MMTLQELKDNLKSNIDALRKEDHFIISSKLGSSSFYNDVKSFGLAVMELSDDDTFEFIDGDFHRVKVNIANQQTLAVSSGLTKNYFRNRNSSLWS